MTKSPTVTIGARAVKYMFSFALPRFCDQSLDRSKKERYYPGVNAPWIAKLDTVVHELYHIDPQLSGIRRLERSDGTYSANCHSDRFFEQVAEMVAEYLDTRPDPSAYDFLRHDFRDARIALRRRRRHELPHVSVVSAALHRAARAAAVVRRRIWRTSKSNRFVAARQPARYTEDDLHIRQFSRTIVAQRLRPQGRRSEPPDVLAAWRASAAPRGARR